MIFVKNNFYAKVPYMEIYFDCENEEEKNFLNENYERTMDKCAEVYTGGRYISWNRMLSESPPFSILNCDSETSSKLEKWVNEEFENYQFQKACSHITLTVELKL